MSTPGDAMNSFLNQNWESIVDEIKPVLEDRISDMFKTFSNNIYHKYPLDMILPPWPAYRVARPIY